MNGRCPICGDSKKNKSKKRFWVHEDNDWYAVTCYNCDLRNNLESFLKEFYPEEYESIRLRCFDQIKSGEVFKTHAKTIVKKREVTTEINDFLKEFLEDNCIKLDEKSNIELYEKLRLYAIKQMVKRNIKEKFWKDFYFCYKGKYRWRVIIPFKDQNNMLYYFQGRDINPKTKDAEYVQKYLTASFKDIKFPDNRLYNFYGANKEETVYICEGLIDSMFLNNSIALCNANVTGQTADLIKETFKNRVWILDNPWIDKTGYLRSLCLLNMGETCFIPPKEFRDCKDINDIAIKLNVKSVDMDIINNNLYKGSVGKMKLKVELIGKWGDDEL